MLLTLTDYYRQKIDVDFGGRVEVYTKQELLNGQNFNPSAVTEQLSVMVLSYDSFRGGGRLCPPKGSSEFAADFRVSIIFPAGGKPRPPLREF